MQITPYNYTTPYEPNSGKQSKKREKKKQKKTKLSRKQRYPRCQNRPKQVKVAYQDLEARIWPQTSETQLAKLGELEKLEGPLPQ